MKRINSVLLALLIILSASAALAQQPSMTELVFPQWVCGDNNDFQNRIATAYRVKISGLNPSTTYKLAAGMIVADDITDLTKDCYGYGYFYFPEYDVSGIFKRSPRSKNPPAPYTLPYFNDIPTNSSGEISFWVLISPTYDDRFQLKSVYLCITHNSGDGSPIVSRSDRIISQLTSKTANNFGTPTDYSHAYIEGHSLAPNGKYVFIYDKSDINQSDRPLHGFMTEDNYFDESSGNGPAPNFYLNNINGRSGRYGLITPLSNSNGIRRIEMLNADGSSYKVATSSNGIWQSGLNTTSLTEGSVYIMSEADAPLPVELQTFTATLQQSPEKVILDWQTATEVNSYCFEVQKKIVNRDWIIIGKVIAHGMSNSPKYYSFQDENLISGQSYYRLKMIDNDGTFSYSPETSIKIGLPRSLTIAQNYPNPFNPVTVISYSLPQNSFVTLRVFDILGKEITILVNEEKSAGNYHVNFNGSNLPSGTYFYCLRADGQYTVKKMVLLK